MDRPFTNYFLLNKDVLNNKLSNARLTLDLSEYTKIAEEFFVGLLSLSSDFMNKFPDMERYILKSVTRLWMESHDFTYNLQPLDFRSTIKSQGTDNHDEIKKELKDGIPVVGAVAGAFVGGPIGALVGTVAGYVIKQTNLLFREDSNQADRPTIDKFQNSREEIIKTLLQQIQFICMRYDEILETFRVQVRNSIPASKEKDPFEKEYAWLLRGIQSLAGSIYDPEKDDDPLQTVKTDLNFLIRDLGNIGLTFVYWDKENPQKNEKYFETFKTNGLESPVMERPAILKNGVMVLPGKIAVPYIEGA